MSFQYHSKSGVALRFPPQSKTLKKRSDQIRVNPTYSNQKCMGGRGRGIYDLRFTIYDCEQEGSDMKLGIQRERSRESTEIEPKSNLIDENRTGGVGGIYDL